MSKLSSAFEGLTPLELSEIMSQMALDGMTTQNLLMSLIVDVVGSAELKAVTIRKAVWMNDLWWLPEGIVIDYGGGYFVTGTGRGLIAHEMYPQKSKTLHPLHDWWAFGLDGQLYARKSEQGFSVKVGSLKEAEYLFEAAEHSVLLAL